jgi:hypothetical protein
LIGRSLDVSPEADPVEAVTSYLSDGRTETARQLAMKAVVVLEPEGLRGALPLSIDQRTLLQLHQLQLHHWRRMERKMARKP